MKLCERLKNARKESGLSQEAVAALIGVSRQAVGSWESGRSLPGTANLLRLCELYGVSPADLCSGAFSASSKQSAEQKGAPVSAGTSCRQMEYRHRLQSGLRGAAAIFLGYAAVYLFCRLIRVPFDGYSLFGWLFGNTASREVGYLYGWLCQQGFFLYSMILSLILAALGLRRCSLLSLMGFSLGILLGELFGPNPAGEAMGAGHYGWLIWGVIFLLFLLAGVPAELAARRGRQKTSDTGAD